MTTATWGAEDCTLYAAWTARAEPVEKIVSRTNDLIDAIGSVLETSTWTMSSGADWGVDPDRQTSMVRAEMVRDDLDEESPREGYHFTMSGEGRGIHISVRIKAGAAFSGRRSPQNHLTVEVREDRTGAFTAEIADALTQAVASTWEPAVTAIRNYQVVTTARRGGWSIPVGYRMWVSSAVGGITTAADGIGVERTSAGTTLKAPDVWTPGQVVEAMVSTLHANDLDRIPVPA